MVFPGFVNVHAHLDKAMLAARIPQRERDDRRGPPQHGPCQVVVHVRDVRERAARALDRCVRHGVTAVRTHVDVDPPSIGLVSLRALTSLKQEYAHAIDLQIVAFPPQEASTSTRARRSCSGRRSRTAPTSSAATRASRRAPPELERQVDLVFEIAKEFDVDIDFHTDFGITRDYRSEVSRHRDGREYPDNLGAVHIAERTIAENYQGRVTASHLCGLDMVPPRTSG